MIYDYDTVDDLPAGVWVWPHVDAAREWACHGTGRLLFVPAFLDKIEALRAACGFPLPIVSGYRSPAHNVAVATTGPHGPHTTGRAVDLRVYGPQAVEVIAHAKAFGFTGLGISQSGPPEKRFLHLDDLEAAPGRPRPFCWSYPHA